MFSQLTGLQVSFTAKPRSTPSKSKLIYGVYSELPGQSTILLRADLPLLASIGGALVGLPDSLVNERIRATFLDETLRDAMHEVLNVTSTLLSTAHRVVFKTMYTDAAHLSGPALSILNSPILATVFDVSIKGYTGGEFSIFADL
jgi:hypothetical protein